jgi:hypothetical protein
MWKRNGIITSNATGPASIMQSDFMSGRPTDPNTGDIHGDFEVVVPEHNNLAHYKHTWDCSQNSWIWKREDHLPITVIKNSRISFLVCTIHSHYIQPKLLSFKASFNFCDLCLK